MYEKSGLIGDVRVAVVRVAGEYGLVCTDDIREGSVIFQLDGKTTEQPTRYSVQVGIDTHIDLPQGVQLEEILDRFYWRFMNHHCEPNAMIRGRDVVAVRNIKPWEQITFNYNTNEYEMAEPFHCNCESEQCMGRIQGFKFLSTEQKEALRHALSDHLVHYIERDVVVVGAVEREAEGVSR